MPPLQFLRLPNRSLVRVLLQRVKLGDQGSDLFRLLHNEKRAFLLPIYGSERAPGGEK